MRTFLNWILTTGQKFVPESGYINLTPARLKTELEKFTAAPAQPVQGE